MPTKISSLALMGVYGRVASVLLETAEPDGNGSFDPRPKVSRQDVAKMVGASREMVSRVMKDFEEQGFCADVGWWYVRVNERRPSRAEECLWVYACFSTPCP